MSMSDAGSDGRLQEARLAVRKKSAAAGSLSRLTPNVRETAWGFALLSAHHLRVVVATDVLNSVVLRRFFGIVRTRRS